MENTKENQRTTKNTEKARFTLTMATSIQVTGSIVRWQVTAFIPGPVVTNTSRSIHKCHLIIYCNTQCIGNIDDAINEQQMGQWKDDKMNGKGTYYWISGDKYTGDWVDGNRTGQGVFTWHNGNRYEGQYKNAKKNGKGTFYYGNSDKYTGDWVYDKKAGQGIFTWSNGDRYE